MKRKQFTFLALLFLMLLCYGAPIKATAEKSGGNSVGYICVVPLKNGSYVWKKAQYIKSHYSVYKEKNIKGLKYDYATNTVTFDNYNGAKNSLYVEGVENTLKIKIIGKNSIGSMIFGSTGHPINVELSGNGTLNVNKKKVSSVTPITVSAANSAGRLTIGKDVKLKINKTNRDDTDSINVYGTTCSSGGIKFEGKASLNKKVKRQSYKDSKYISFYILDKDLGIGNHTNLSKYRAKEGTIYAEQGITECYEIDIYDSENKIHYKRLCNIDNVKGLSLPVAKPLLDKDGNYYDLTSDELSENFEYINEDGSYSGTNAFYLTYISDQNAVYKKKGDSATYALHGNGGNGYYMCKLSKLDGKTIGTIIKKYNSKSAIPKEYTEQKTNYYEWIYPNK